MADEAQGSSMKSDIIVLVVIVVVVIVFLMMTQKPAPPATSTSTSTHSQTGLDGLISSINPGVLAGLMPSVGGLPGSTPPTTSATGPAGQTVAGQNGTSIPSWLTALV